MSVFATAKADASCIYYLWMHQLRLNSNYVNDAILRRKRLDVLRLQIPNDAEDRVKNQRFCSSVGL